MKSLHADTLIEKKMSVAFNVAENGGKTESATRIIPLHSELKKINSNCVGRLLRQLHLVKDLED